MRLFLLGPSNARYSTPGVVLVPLGHCQVGVNAVQSLRINCPMDTDVRRMARRGSFGLANFLVLPTLSLRGSAVSVAVWFVVAWRWDGGCPES